MTAHSVSHDDKRRRVGPALSDIIKICREERIFLIVTRTIYLVASDFEVEFHRNWFGRDLSIRLEWGSFYRSQERCEPIVKFSHCPSERMRDVQRL